jgi:PAS domain S-box-containing protein
MITDPKILILEDNDSDADLLCRELKKSGMAFTSKVVQNRQEYEQALENFYPDIILSDYALPAFDAVTAYKIKQARHPLVPFIIVSGIIGEENAVDLINSGVTDYASKNNFIALPAKIQRAFKDTKIRLEKLLADEQLKIQAAELVIANRELVLQNEEKEQNAQQLRRSNELLIEEKEKVRSINLELSQLNLELEDRVASRTKALADSEHRFRNMMETIPQIAWTNTISGVVNFYNRRWYDYTGLDIEQTQALGFSKVIHPDDLKVGLDQFTLLYKSQEGGEFQIRAKRSDGIYRWHLICVMPNKNADGKLVQWVGTATDIQELKLLQQHKDDFISIASHELKTPITSLKASLQLLDRMKDKPSPVMLPKLITQASKSLDKIYVLINDLLNSSQANEGQLIISCKNYNLFSSVNECCENILRESGFTYKIEGEATLEVYADPTRIEQVVTNFITNALKYAPESKELSIQVETLSGMAKVSIIDKGNGIPAENLPSLFDRYYRVDHSGTIYSGLGLGLYICSEIIKKHNGTIGVDSEIGKGSAFWFTLPIS